MSLTMGHQTDTQTQEPHSTTKQDANSVLLSAQAIILQDLQMSAMYVILSSSSCSTVRGAIIFQYCPSALLLSA